MIVTKIPNETKKPNLAAEIVSPQMDLHMAWHYAATTAIKDQPLDTSYQHQLTSVHKRAVGHLETSKPFE
jgi:hypothetical protein